MWVPVGLSDGVSVEVGLPGWGVWVNVKEGVRLGLGLALKLAEGEGSSVGECDSVPVRLWVRVAEAVGLQVGLKLGVKEGETEALRVTEGVREGVAVGAKLAETLKVGLKLGVQLRMGLGVGERVDVQSGPACTSMAWMVASPVTPTKRRFKTPPATVVL